MLRGESLDHMEQSIDDPGLWKRFYPDVEDRIPPDKGKQIELEEVIDISTNQPIRKERGHKVTRMTNLIRQGTLHNKRDQNQSEPIDTSTS